MLYLKFCGYDHLVLKSNGRKCNLTLKNGDKVEKNGAFKSSLFDILYKIVVRIKFVQHLMVILIILFGDHHISKY
jgi:hypothetical protein